MYINSVHKSDVIYGNKKENDLLMYLNKYFNTELHKTPSYDEFDFIDKNKKIMIELKSRRIYKEMHYDTMIGYNKVIRGKDIINAGYRVYFVFSFKDGLYYYELKEDNIKKKWIKMGGRCDRGKSEIKRYCYIPTHLLTNIK